MSFQFLKLPPLCQSISHDTAIRYPQVIYTLSYPTSSIFFFVSSLFDPYCTPFFFFSFPVTRHGHMPLTTIFFLLYVIYKLTVFTIDFFYFNKNFSEYFIHHLTKLFICLLYFYRQQPYPIIVCQFKP